MALLNDTSWLRLQASSASEAADGASLGPSLPFQKTHLFKLVMEVLSSSVNTSAETFSIDLTEAPSTRSLPAVYGSGRLFPPTTFLDNASSAGQFDVYADLRDQSMTAMIVVVGFLFASLTTLGNLMVMISFKLDKQLQTISNYFLFSLAVADITIGLISIPLMTYYTAARTWGIGYTACQFWLCVDYLMSNASVLNLLLISFDRYFSVTRPLTYRPRRTTKKALTMIAITFIISAILWPPWIISWPYIEGKFTVEPGTCVVQFLETNPYITVITAVAAFYCPVTIMIVLYARVYKETQRRQADFAKLQAGGRKSINVNKINLRKVASSNSIVKSASMKKKQILPFLDGLTKSKRSSRDRRSSWLKACTARSENSSEESSEVLPANLDDTSLASSVCVTSLGGRKSKHSPTLSPTNGDSFKDNTSGDTTVPDQSPHKVATNGSGRFRSRAIPDRPMMHTYTVLIELRDGEGKRPSVRLSSCDSEYYAPNVTEIQPPPMRESQRIRSRSEVPPTTETPNDSMKRPATAENGRSYTGHHEVVQRKSEKERRKNERKQESKAAKTLSAILFAFIVTWTPYNVIVCWEAFFPKTIPTVLFTISYCLCYVNSTVNPLCYALCNARFRTTYTRILTCSWNFGNRNGNQNRGYFRRQ